MARKFGSINMVALESEEEQEKKFIHGAQLSERGNTSKGGRPKVEEKADKAMTVYFTEAERETVKNYCNRISFSSLVKQMLQEKGVL